jgi:predicted XRE-type DNA-binding protein
MDVNAMAKQECYVAFMRLVDKQNLNGQRKLAKALKIKEKEAKSLINGNLEDFSQSDIIRLTASLIRTRVDNGASEEA